MTAGTIRMAVIPMMLTAADRGRYADDHDPAYEEGDYDDAWLNRRRRL